MFHLDRLRTVSPRCIAIAVAAVAATAGGGGLMLSAQPSPSPLIGPRLVPTRTQLRPTSRSWCRQPNATASPTPSPGDKDIVHEIGEVIRRLGAPLQGSDPEASTEAAALHAALQHLPPKQAAALILRHHHGYSNREIGVSGRP